MTRTETETIVRALYEALGSRDLEGAAGRVSGNVLLVNIATGDVYRGRSGFLDHARGWCAAFPDSRLELMKFVADEGRATAEYELHGTHTGPLLTPRGHVPPTSMEVRVRFCDVLEIVEGQVAHIRSYFDSVTLLRQLGLLTTTPLHNAERRAGLGLYAQPVESHAPLRHKVIVQRYVQEVFNRQNPGALADTCSQGFTWHGGSLGEARSLTAYRQVLAIFFAAFPDLHLEILDTVAEGDRIAIRYSLSGTHLGEFQGIPATYKRITSAGMNVYRIEESRIVEEWWQGDMLILLQQIDAAPSTLRIGT